MEQTRQKRTAKILFATVLTFVVTLAMVFAILPQATLTAYAAGGTEVTQANVICQQYSYMDAGDYSGGSMYDTPPVEITNITLADAQAFGASVTCPTTYWIVVYATDGDNLKWTSNGKTGEQTSTPRSSSLSAWCELYNDDVFHFGGNYDPMKDVTFYFSKGLVTPTETLLTTITATGQEQASYSVENIATVSFSYTAQGSSAYLNNGKTNWGWWGYGWTATVNASEGYIITKCVFYDDKDRTATDSETPFVVETTEEDKTPQVNGTPILAYQSKGITKIEVYGYATLVKKDVTSISLNKNTTTILIGNNETLTATVSPNDATYKTVVWLSDNTNVAEVDSNGKITAKSVGSANITARATNGTDDTSDDFTATCVVTVNAIDVTGVNLNINTTTILVGNNETLTATISPNNATYKTLIWSSDNTNVAEVNSNGKVTAKSAGTAIITARATNGTDDTSDDFTASCVVTVHAHNYTVTVNGSTATVKCSNDCPNYKEYTVSLNATDKDYDGTTNVATITKSNDLPNTILVGTINYVGRDGTTYNSTTAPTNVGKYTASVTVGDKTITKNFEIKALAPVSFISSVTYNPSRNTVTIVVTTIRQYIILTSTTTIWQNNYYIAKNDVTINGPVYYGANVSLILFDDVTLLIRGGLKRFGSELTIYGQEGQDGLLQIEGSDNDYVIDGDNITVNGGRINLVTGTNGTLFSNDSSITFNSALNLTATNSQGDELVLESGKTYTGSELNEYTNFETTTKLATLTNVSVSQTGTLTYNGNPQTAVVSASATAQNENQVVFTYSASENGTYTTEVPAFTNAGTYTVYFKANAENHEEATGSFVVTIGKADIVLTTPTAIQNLVYTGNTQALVAAGTAEGGEMQYALGENATTAPADNLYTTSIPTATNAGTYYVWYKIAGDENHNDTNPTCIELTLNKATPSYTAPTDLVATYGDTLNDVTLTTGWVWNVPTTSVGTVGTHTFAATFTPSDTANYNTVEQNLTVTVNANDKSALIAAIGSASEYYNSISSEHPDIAATLQNAIDVATSVKNDDNKTEAEISDAVTALNSALDQAKADENQAKASIVKALIAAIGTVEYTTESKGKIDEAREAYDALSDDQKALVDTYETLTTAESNYNTLKADNDAADEVKALIAAIGEVAYTTESKDKIDEARAAYNGLTAEQKALVTNYTDLTTAESDYNTLKADNDAADEVKALIAAIGEVTYTTESKGKIDEARAAYNGLTAEQKALVDNYATLTTAETTYAAEKKTAEDNAAANAVKEKIAAIGTVEYATESKDKIDEAKAAYDALTADQKALVDTYETLTTAESTYNTLKANNEAADEVKALIDSIGTVELTVNSKAVIDLARESYDGLTTDQKALVSNYDVLTAAEVRYADLGAADEVKTLVDAIGDVTYSTESKDKIDAAREAYDALTADQKALVTNYGTLTSAEGNYTDLKAVKEAEDAVSVLPASDDITVTDKAAVAAAKAKYDTLTPAQKATVSAETVAKLSAASNMVAAQEVVVSIGNIDADNPDSAKVTEARAAYDALTDEQKAKVTNYESLTAAESKLIEINNPEKKGLSGGAIAGIVIAFVVVLGALGALLFSYFKQKKAEKK